MHHTFKKALTVITTAVLLSHTGTLTAFAKPDWPSDTGIMAETGIIVDMDSKAVLFGQGIHVASPPASITKLLTALIVAENCELEETVTFSYDAIYNVEAGSVNRLELEEGDTLSVKDCLYAMLLVSSNPAANALAEHTAGSRQVFAVMMNDKLKELGCKKSNFANPSGLNDDNQYVSAYDMALIAIAAFENETVLEISSSKNHTMPATKKRPDGSHIKMEHKLLMASGAGDQFYLEGAVAGKTGFTRKAGNTLVTYARRDGRNLVSVILKGTQPQYYMDAKTIMNFGFAAFKNMPVSGNETFLSEIQQLEANGTTYPVSELSLDTQAVITLPGAAQFSDAERTLVTDLPAGRPEDAAAMLKYTYNDRVIGRSYIYAESLKAAPAASDDTAGSQEPAESSGAEADTPLTPSDSGETDQNEALSDSGKDDQNEAPSDSGKDDQNEAPSDKKSSDISWIAALVVFAVLGLSGGIFAYIRYRQCREWEALAKRKERRRQRLLESGVSEEEFAALLQRRTRGKGQDSSDAY